MHHICSNESEYYQKVKTAKFNELYHKFHRMKDVMKLGIDEQKEAKFGAGSFREEMGIMDCLDVKNVAS